jgi:hypothetical protein
MDGKQVHVDGEQVHADSEQAHMDGKPMSSRQTSRHTQTASGHM